MPGLNLNELLKQIAMGLGTFTQGALTPGDAGQTCTLPKCRGLTLGVRCDKCARILCPKHTYWSLTLKHMTATCPYCVLQACPELFRDSLDDDGTEPVAPSEPDVIDAEIVDDD